MSGGSKFAWVSGAVFADSRLSKTALKVYVSLCSFADKNGECFPTQYCIAEQLNLRRETVSRAISELEKHNWLAVKRTRENGRFKTSRYKLISFSPCEVGSHMETSLPCDIGDHMDRVTYVVTSPCEVRGHNELSKENYPKKKKVKLPEFGSVEWAYDLWNEVAAQTDLSKCIALTDKRRKSIQARLNDTDGAGRWDEALTKIQTSPFLLGKNDRAWKATFDWFVKPDSIIKILENKYAGQLTKLEAPRSRAEMV